MDESWKFDTDLNFEDRTDVFITSRNRRTNRRNNDNEEKSSTSWLDWADSGWKKTEDFS